MGLSLVIGKPWSRMRIEGLVRSYDMVYEPLSGTHVFTDGEGWLGLRLRAYDKGDTDLILDCVRFEQALDSIKDDMIRAAVILRCFGFDETSIGSMLRSRRSGSSMVDEGIRLMHRFELNRKDGLV